MKTFSIRNNTHEIQQAANTLAQALANDPMMEWLFDDKDHYKKNAIPLIATWVKYTSLYGMALRTENFECVALRKKPGDTEFTFWRMLRSGMLKSYKLLGKKAFNRLMVLDKTLITEKEKVLGGQSAWYCWNLGTLPDKQHQGFGRTLIEKTFATADRDKLPCYLETANPVSRETHKKFGYHICHEFVIPDSELTMWSMLRKNSEH